MMENHVFWIWYHGNTMFLSSLMTLPWFLHLNHDKTHVFRLSWKYVFLYHVLMSMVMHVCFCLHHGSTMFFLLHYGSNYYFFQICTIPRSWYLSWLAPLLGFLTCTLVIPCVFFFYLQYDDTIWCQGHGFWTCTMVILCFLDMLPW